MKISDRLLTIASFIKPHANVADVGADHGLIEKYLLDNDRVNSILAIENKSGPFNILKNNLKDYDVTLSLSDGISQLNDNIDTIVIAGMGGILVSDILEAHLEKLTNVNQIVVDAHRDNELVRQTITKLGYYIEKEKIVFENNIYYFVISFLKGHKNHTALELEFGYKINEDPLFEQYKEKELQTLELNLAKYKSSEKFTRNGLLRRTQKIKRLSSL